MLFSGVAAVFAEVEGTASRLEMSSTVAKLLSAATPAEARRLVYIMEGDRKSVV